MSIGFVRFTKNPSSRYFKFRHCRYVKNPSLHDVRGNPVWIYHQFVSFGCFLSVTWRYFKDSSPLEDDSGVLVLWILLETVILGYFRGLSLGDNLKDYHLRKRKSLSLGYTSEIPLLRTPKGSSVGDISGVHYLGIIIKIQMWGLILQYFNGSSYSIFCHYYIILPSLP